MMRATMSVPFDVEYPQRIRSFVRRAGRTTAAQARALAEVGPRVLVPYAAQALRWPEVFGRTVPVVLEVGFGMGEATAQIAHAMPDRDFLCCEVHEPGVGALLKRVHEGALSNVRIVAHDAVEVLQHMVPAASLAGVHVFFPDPWHKKRHHKRRLVQPDWVAMVASRLAPGGYVHCATDWQPYAEHMLAVLQGCTTLRNTASDASGYATRPAYRPRTKFETRGLRLGHGVWDVVFTRPA